MDIIAWIALTASVSLLAVSAWGLAEIRQYKRLAEKAETTLESRDEEVARLNESTSQLNSELFRHQNNASVWEREVRQKRMREAELEGVLADLKNEITHYKSSPVLYKYQPMPERIVAPHGFMRELRVVTLSTSHIFPIPVDSDSAARVFLMRKIIDQLEMLLDVTTYKNGVNQQTVYEAKLNVLASKEQEYQAKYKGSHANFVEGDTV